MNPKAVEARLIFLFFDGVGRRTALRNMQRGDQTPRGRSVGKCQPRLLARDAFGEGLQKSVLG